MNRHRFVAATLILLAASITLAGCGRDKSADNAAEPVQIRTPVPTFTPTSPANIQADVAAAPAAVAPLSSRAAQPSGDQPAAEQPAAAAPAEQPAAAPQGIGGPVVAVPSGGIPPVAVINTELVNSRTGPDTSFPIATILGRGEDFDITGRSDDGAWWRICCLVDLREVWVSAEFVDSDGPTDRVPVAQASETSELAKARQGGAERVVAAPTVEPAPAAEAASEPPAVAVAAQEQPTAAPAAAESAPQPEASVAVASAEAGAATGGFALSGQEQFPETNVVRIFAYVFADNQGIEGYSLRVTKDGAEQSVTGSSFGGQPGMTWPIADDRQRFQNFKAEFPGVAAAGVWTVELTHDGAVVGPAASFTLTENDPASELYVRYKRN